jgi:hypothetical protein
MSPNHMQNLLATKTLKYLTLQGVTVSGECGEYVSSSVIANGGFFLEELRLNHCTWEKEINVPSIVNCRSLLKLEIGKVSSSTATNLFQELCINEYLEFFSVENMDGDFEEDVFISLIKMIKQHKVMERMVI